MENEIFWVSGVRSGSRSIGCRSTGVFKAGKFEKEILLQFPQMKCICMILTSNRSESCNRNVLSKNMVFQGRKGKVQNFGMASAACVTSYRMLIHGRF